MPIGRGQLISIRGLPTNLRSFASKFNASLRELDRRKPVVEPMAVNDDVERPAAEQSPGKIIFDRVSKRLQYSDGDDWREALASTTSFATPTLAFGTTASTGTLDTVIRSDAGLAIFDTTVPAAIAATAATGSAAFAARRDHVHLFPTSLRSTANGSTLALTDDGTNQAVTASLGSLTVVAGGGTIFLDPNTTGGNAAVVNVRPSSTGGVGLQPNYSTTNLSSGTVRIWNLSASHTSQLVSSTFVGYDMQTYSFTPSAGSDSANVIYGGRLVGPLINNATGGFTEVATLYLQGARRLAANPTVTLAGGAIIECPAISATEQAGIYIKQRTAQQVAANRYGIKIDTHNSGTARWMLYLGTDPSYFGGNIRQDDSIKWVGGTGQDSEIYYDGTNLIADPDVVGTGRLLIGATGDDDMLLNAIEIDGALNHDGTTVGFYGVAPTTRSAAYTPTNVTADRAYDANSTTIDEIADVLGTLIADLQLTGIIG